MTLEFIIPSIALFVFGLLLVMAALRLRSEKTMILHLILFAGLGFLSNLFQLMTLLEITALPDISPDLLSQIALWATVLAFGALTLNFLKKKQNILLGYWGGVIIILLIWNVLAFNLWPIPFIFGVDSIFVLAGLSWVLAIITACVALSTEFRKRQSAQHVNRLRYWLIATSLLGVSGLMMLASPSIFYSAGVALILAGSVLVGYTVVSYHTPDLNLLAGRTLHYLGITSIVAVIVYLSLAATIIVSRTVTNRMNVFFGSVILAILLAIVIRPLWLFSSQFLSSIIFGHKYRDDKQIIKHYSQRVSAALDIQRLGDIVIELMIETLGIEQGVIFANEKGQQRGRVSLRPLSSVGMAALTTGEFNIDSLFIDHFRKGNKILQQYDVDVLPEFSALRKEERAWLSTTELELYVPVLRNRELVGMLGFGPRSPGTAYYEEDMELMIALADQAALAMDSARLFEQLATINLEVGSLSEQLAGMDQTKTDFLSIASHELRTPLTHIHGYSRMLLELTEEELQDPAHFRSITEGIVRGSDRMKEVVDVMFAITEANIGDMSLFLGPVMLEEVIDQAARPFLTALDERRIAFGKTGFEDLPILEADGTRLVQALTNLIGNAIKYTPDGGIVTIEGQPIVNDELGYVVEIVVSDNGIGIDSEHHERIFEKFFRVGELEHHSTGQTKFKGAGPGLGLTLVKSIAEAHGGRVWVESPGHDEDKCPGSKFFFVIPLQQAIQPTIEETPKQSEIETVHWHSKNSKPDQD
jgi:signal transduction histidine kinase